MKILPQVEWKMNIPNALSLLRLLLLPVFATLYLMSDRYPALLYWSFAVLVLSGITDSLDGIIARKFHQITDLGKILDPVADKLTQVTVVLCLAIRNPAMISLLVICFVKELCQGIGGLFLLRRGAKIHGAKWYGKVSTFVFYGVMALIVLWPGMPMPLMVALIVLVAVLMLFAFFNYMKVFFSLKKDMPAGSDQPDKPAAPPKENP
ncbi:MAG TPA: CDP-alcohol phosphatidyltransferase family protein [Firmicutes bacterium]|nr:CDP-alcohol phosphatidyltransferase family protein [Bacillota bacterium]